MRWLFGAFALLLALSGSALAGQAESDLTMAIVAFGKGDLAAARSHLEAAQQATTDPALLAKINRQRGIIDSAEGKRFAAVMSFMRALYFDSRTELDPREHRGEVQRLFDCAYVMFDKGLSEKAVEIRYEGAFASESWTCPATSSSAPPPPPPPAVAPPPPGRTAPPPPPTTIRRRKRTGSVWTSPVLWVIVGSVVVVAAAGTATGVLATQEMGYSGNTGTNIILDR